MLATQEGNIVTGSSLSVTMFPHYYYPVLPAVEQRVARKLCKCSPVKRHIAASSAIVKSRNGGKGGNPPLSGGGPVNREMNQGGPTLPTTQEFRNKMRRLKQRWRDSMSSWSSP